MALEATIGGEGVSLVVRVFGYERPALESGFDANWLRAEGELTARGSFSGRLPLALLTMQLESFRVSLADLTETLDGEAVLHDLEGQVGCTIRLTHGVGEFEGFLRENIGAELRVAEMRIDQSYVQAALRDFTALMREFPVKGDPSG